MALNQSLYQWSVLWMIPQDPSNDFQPQYEAPFQELLRRMQYDAQLWNNLLYCSGGKLELPKCSFHVLRFEFRPNGTPIPEIASHDGAIHITDLETNREIPIPSKRAFETHKTLGHFKSPTSRQQTELNNLREKAERISVLISISPLTRQGASLAYHTIYNPEHPLHTSTILLHSERT